MCVYAQGTSLRKVHQMKNFSRLFIYKFFKINFFFKVCKILVVKYDQPVFFLLTSIKIISIYSIHFHLSLQKLVNKGSFTGLPLVSIHPTTFAIPPSLPSYVQFSRNFFIGDSSISTLFQNFLFYFVQILTLVLHLSKYCTA